MEIPGQQEAQNLMQVVEKWRMHAFSFLSDEAPGILWIIIEALVLIILLKVITKRLERYSRNHVLPGGVRAQQLRTVGSVVNSVGMFVIVFLAIMQILPKLGINIGPLLASAGIVGLAIGFGAQTLVKDVINGFFILFENQYDIGDIVRISGVSGTVENMTLRRTVLRDFDGSVHVIPNSEIKIVSNLTRDWTQVAMHIAVDYREDSERIIGLLKEVGAELRSDPAYAEFIVADPQVPGIEKVAGDEVDYLMVVKTKPEQRYAIMRELRRRIKDCFHKNSVKPGGPHRFYVMGGDTRNQADAPK